MKKKLSVFFKIYCAVCAAFLLILLVGVLILSSVLKAYESAQPVHQAQAIFDRYFASGDFCGALEMSGTALGAFETADRVAEGIAKISEGKELLFYSVAAEENEAKYAVIAAEKAEEVAAAEETETEALPPPTVHSQKIATMTFEKRGDKGKWGFENYSFAGMEFNIKGAKTVLIQAPDTSKVSLNGVALDETYIKETVPSGMNDYLPEGVPGITLRTYEVSELFTEPTVTSLDRNGAAQTVEKDSTGTYIAALNYDEALQKEYASYVLKGAETYATYMQNDGALGRVAEYFDTSSSFYKDVRTSLVIFVWDHTGYRFEDEVVDRFYAYDENTFSCHVSFTHYLTKTGSQDYRDTIDMTLFLRKINGKYKIYDRIVEG